MSRFDMDDLNRQLVPVQPTEIDGDKWYDLYCHLHSAIIIVYRNVKIKGNRRLPGDCSMIGERYCMIEREDGTELLLSTIHMFMVCEHGADPGFAEVTIAKQ